MEDTLLYEMFRPYGTIQSAKVKKDVFSFDSKGYGFVCYNTKEEAQRAMEELRYKECQGQELQIYIKKPNMEFNQDANLFFKNIGKETKAKELHKMCEKYGNILSCKIKKDDKGNNLGYAYV